MNKFLTIQVVCPDHVNVGQEKILYRNTIAFDDSVDVPFKTLIEAFKVLYNKPDTKVVFGCEL